jgi:alkylation response protein AidB-like acyl-CoA dehydrogenase
MDFEFNEEQKFLSDAAKKMYERQIEPLMKSYDRDKPFPKDAVLKVIKMLKQFGVEGARLPAEDGGTGLGAVGLGIVCEQVSFDIFLGACLLDLIGLRISLGGSPEVKQKFLPRMQSGNYVVASAISEPNVGSDPTGIETKAVLDGDHYVINGTKMWSSYGDICDLAFVVVSLGRDARGKNLLTRIMVDQKESPFETRHTELMGLRQGHVGEIVFQDCRVPKENLVGGVGDAHGNIQASWISQRPIEGLGSKQTAQRALDLSIAYAKERVQFGKPLAGFQLISGMLAEMYTMVEAARLLCFQALSISEKGVWCAKEAGIAKWFSNDMAVKVTSMAVSIHGAMGVATECEVEQLYRDARTLTFPAAAIEIEKLIVGRDLTGISAIR